MLKSSGSGSSARQARHASPDSECLAFPADLSSCCPSRAGLRRSAVPKLFFLSLLVIPRDRL